MRLSVAAWKESSCARSTQRVWLRFIAQRVCKLDQQGDKLAPGVNAIAAVHSHALRQGRSSAVNNRFTPFANHAEFWAATLASVQIEPLGVNATTRSRNTVTFSDTATARSYARMAVLVGSALPLAQLYLSWAQLFP